MKPNRVLSVAICFCLLSVTPPFTEADESTSKLIQQMKSVAGQGENHDQARQALGELQQQDASSLLPILQGLDDANPLASNWLRNAFEVIASETLSNGKSLPVEDLLNFVRRTKNRAVSRRLAFEWIRKVQPETAKEMIPQFLNDPSDELRREAVARLLEQAEKSNDESRQEVLYQQALTGASDDDQVRVITKALKEFGKEIDLQRHYGFISSWHLIGPFNNKEEAGFDVAYPPEQEINLNAEYEGQMGTVSWKQYETDDDYGVLDIAKDLGPFKGAIVYGTAEFESAQEQPVEFRLSTPNAWKLWLNGELLFEREEYHRGTFFDQYRVPARLKKGTNVLLLKTCQNEQEQSWAQDWKIQFRVCQPTGMALQPVKK